MKSNSKVINNITELKECLSIGRDISFSFRKSLVQSSKSICRNENNTYFVYNCIDDSDDVLSEEELDNWLQGYQKEGWTLILD